MANLDQALDTAEPTLAEKSAQSPDRPSGRSRLHQTFAALKYPNYRLWFFGQLISLVGTWTQGTAQGYFVYELTKSPEYLGYVGFAAGLPTWIFMLYGGVIADRVPRRWLLVITQTAMMLLAFILAVMTFLGVIQPWHIILLAFLLGTAQAFDTPARLAFVPELVEREDLTNAIALNSTMFNMATTVGPAVAGITYAALGPGWCFTINGISFIAVIIALLVMKLKPWKPPATRVPGFRNMAVGLRFVAGHSVVRTIVLGIGTVSLFGLGYVTLFPAWAVDILGGDAATTGLLHSARGLGALIGALTIASLGRFQFRGRLLTIGSFVFPVLLIVFAFIRWLPLSLVTLAVMGWGFMIFINLSNSLVQTQVPDEVRGRAMSVYSMSFFGLMPIGALLAGQAAGIIGEPATVIAGGVILLGISTLTLLRFPELRKIP
jgi:MFS family permease